MNARRAFLAATAALLVPARHAAANDVSGVALPDRARPEGSEVELRLLGGGLFRFFFMRYYVCGLYASDGPRVASAILANDAPRRIHLVALRRITSFEFLWGLDQGLADNLSPAEAEALREPLAQVRATIRAIGAIARGARVFIDYVPRAGTSIVVDELRRGERFAGKALNDALMRVWIGERPLDASLKEALLGGGRRG
jgi:long-chain acyl-CoA synthetase